MKDAFIYLLAISLLMFSCGDDDTIMDQVPDPQPEDTIMVFEGVHLFDINAAAIGCFGECGNDWSNFDLSEEELKWLDFEDAIDLSDASDEQSTFEFLHIYPMPIANNGNVFLGGVSNNLLKLKFAIIDNKGNILTQRALSFQEGNNDFNISSEVFADFERKEIFRMFYAVYTKAEEIIYSGYGDIAICSEDVNPTYDTCFP